jgi:ribonuclease G
MRQEILINITSREVRVALVENGVLQELLIERMSRRGLIGNVYIGKVSRVLPGMQAAFVDMVLRGRHFYTPRIFTVRSRKIPMMATEMN